MASVETPHQLAEQAVLKTLLYSDIFDFPLSRNELWEFLVTRKNIGKELFTQILDNLTASGQIFHMNGYFCIAGRKKIIDKRQENLPEVEKKLGIARKAAYYLSYIPTIKFIGISGGLAMYDVDAEDDIDFFIITKRKTLFMTRIWILGFLQFLKLRRVRSDKNPADKICVNYLIDEENLKFKKDKHDIYIAHEIAQVKPLFERENTGKKFFKTNQWIKQFFPNADTLIDTHILPRKTSASNSFKFLGFIMNLRPVSSFLEWLQIRYIKRHQTIEMVSNHAIAFHPYDYRVQTLKELKLRFQQLGLLTKE